MYIGGSGKPRVARKFGNCFLTSAMIAKNWSSTGTASEKLGNFKCEMRNNRKQNAPCPSPRPTKKSSSPWAVGTTPHYWASGSTARGDATRKSDVDVMARFSKRKSLLDLVRIEREMSDALGRKVDLLTEASISPHLRDRILDEMIVLSGTPPRTTYPC
jgi:predicted nucleotidyltransferase